MRYRGERRPALRYGLRRRKDSSDELAPRSGKYSYLLRTVFTMLVAASIPIVLITVFLISNERKTISNSVYEQLDAVAQSVAAQFNECVISMVSANYHLQELQVGAMATNRSVTSDWRILDALSSVNGLLSFADDCGLYVGGSINSIYTSAGKYRPEIYAKHVWNLEEQLLIGALSETKEARIKPFAEDLMIFMAPLRDYYRSGDSFQRSFYVLTSESLDSVFRLFLGERYQIGEIIDPQGGIVYRASDFPFHADGIPMSVVELERESGKLLSTSAVGSMGYRLAIYADASELQQNTDRLVRYALTMLVVAVMLCILLIGLAVYVNQKGLRRLFTVIRSTRGEPDIYKDELDYISKAYTAQYEEKNQLALQLAEHHVMIRDRLFEKLLNGQPLTDREAQIIDFDAPHYFVAVVRLSGLSGIDDIIRDCTHCSDLHVIEMYSYYFKTITHR